MKGNVTFDSEKRFISTNNVEFFLNENLLRLSTRLDTGGERAEIYGHLRSNALNLMSINLIPEEITIDGSAAVDITFEGLIPDLNLNLDLSLAEGSINDLELKNLVSKLRYYQGNTYLDQLNLAIIENGQFTASGIYLKNQNYSISLEGRNIDLGLLEHLKISGGDSLELPGLKGITGRINFSANLTGNEPGLDKLNTTGELEIVEPCIFLPGSVEDNELGRKISFSRMKSNFYITKEKLYLQAGKISSDWAEIALAGEIGLNDMNIKIELDSNSINLMGMEKVLSDELLVLSTDDNKLRGEVQLKGLLEGNILDPALEVTVYSKEGSYRGIRYDDLSAEISYCNKEISIMGLDFRYNDTPIFGNALIDLDSEEPQISGVISSDKFNYDLLTYGNIKHYQLKVIQK